MEKGNKNINQSVILNLIQDLLSTARKYPER